MTQNLATPLAYLDRAETPVGAFFVRSHFELPAASARAIADVTGNTVSGRIFSGGTAAPGSTGSIGIRYTVSM